MNYSLNFYIPISKNNDFQVFEVVCEMLEYVKLEYSEIYPHYYTAWSKNKAEEYINVPEKLQKHFKSKYAVCLFSSQNEDVSCGYILNNMFLINGYFVLKVELPSSINMSDKENIKKYDKLFKEMILRSQPDYAFVNTDEFRLISKEVRRGKNNYDFIFWRIYCSDDINSKAIELIKNSNIGYLDRFNNGYYYMLSEFDMEHLTDEELKFWKMGNGIII